MLSRFVMSQVKHNSYFLAGLIIGLWLALVTIPLDEDIQPCESGSTTQLADEFEPQREEKPLGSAGQVSGRSMQRPRYYSTELGMRASLLAGALSSEAALGTRVAALNRTAARLQPALRFFITASALQAAPGLANVVGFTDTREMLKPFHALKYLADNYLEEYNFFFLVSDLSFVNARRLSELVSRLSVSQDVYMGTVVEDDSHYCSLDGGILISNSVLRMVHSELDWCVRNSYSPHHHENLGRCILHASKLACTSTLQGESYVSMHVDGEELGMVLTPSVADAVTVHPVAEPHHFYELHVYVSRVFLERDQQQAVQLRSYLWRNSRRHPPAYRNTTWPGGLRADPGLAPPRPDNRFDHLRWTTFNGTHALLPDDHHNVAPLVGPHRKAVDLVMETIRAWCANRWAGDESSSAVELVEGAWRWEPATALRYRLLVRHTLGLQRSVRMVEVVRPLGAARLVPVPYVTESERVSLVLPVAAGRERSPKDMAVFLQRYEAVCLDKDKNTALTVVVVRGGEEEAAGVQDVRDAVEALAAKYRGSQLELVETTAAGPAARAALAAVLARLSRDALVLMAVPHMEFNEDFLNRVRMNTIAGTQWFLPVPFARHAQFVHPRFREPDGSRPQVNTGRFNLHHSDVLAFYRKDFDSALSEYHPPQDQVASIADILSRSALHCIRAPEPGLVLSPRPAPCPGPMSGASTVSGANTAGAGGGSEVIECLHAERDEEFRGLDLGARHTLAKLLLEIQAES